MRILLITDSFLPSLGGVERHTYTLARYLSMHSHEVTIITSTGQDQGLDCQFDSKLKELNCFDISRCLIHKTNLPFLSVPRYVDSSRRLVKYINENSHYYDLVHYHGTRQLLLKNVKAKSPILTSVHGIFPVCVMQLTSRCKKQSMLNCTVCDLTQSRSHTLFAPVILPYYFSYYKLMRRSLNHLDKVVCVSNYVKDSLEQNLNLENLETIYNFIDYKNEIEPELNSARTFDARKYLRIPAGAKIFVYFGSLTSIKGLHILLGAFRKIKREIGNNAYLVIGGSGPLRASLEKTAQFIDNVKFTGTLSRNNQLSLMAQSDIFIHPTIYPDACPTSVIEAMALGLPIISTFEGGVPELIVHNKGGYLVESNNVLNLAEAMLNLVNNEDDCKRFSLFSKNRASLFDIENIGPSMIQLYKQTICL